MNGFHRARIVSGVALACAVLAFGPGCAGGGLGEPEFSGCRLGGGGSDEPDPVPLSRYVGTWSGSWAALDEPLPGATAMRGDMTLAVAADGSLSGQLTNATTGEAGSVSGTIAASGGTGIGNITTRFGEREHVADSAIVIVQGNGHLGGSMRVPAGPAAAPPAQPGTLPGTPTGTGFSVLASFDLTRQ